MEKRKRIIISSFLAATVFFSGFIGIIKLSVTAETTVSNKEIVSDTMEWTYLDRDVEVAVRDATISSKPEENGKLTGEKVMSGDPNAYTWYSRWNKRNGWAYPSTFLDHGLFNMDFSSEKWAKAKGKSFSTDASLSPQVQLLKNENGTVREGYFLRYSFHLDDPKDIYAIMGNVTYKDAMIIYVNGKPVESLFNIPMSNYSKNMQYGSKEEMANPKTENFIVEDVSSLVAGENTIAIELHTSNKDSEAFVSLNSFILNPSEENLPTSDPVKSIAINTGADETKTNFAWYSLSNKPGEIQIMEGNNITDFNVEQAKKISATTPEFAYKKFIDTKYYSNKVVVGDMQLGKNYVYRVGNADAWSDVYILKTSDISNGYGAIFVSDPQIGTGTIPTDVHGWKQTLNDAFIKHPNANFIINTGDFVDVATKEGEYDGYFAPDQLKSYPSATAVGNHDVGINYKHHYNEPNLSGYGSTIANSNYYYTYGKVLYIVLNTSSFNYDEHREYLEKVISDTKDMDLDWKVVMFHQSLYSGGTQATIQQNIDRRTELVPIFDKLGIDIAFMGHDHGYVRTHQMKNFDPQEPSELVNGYERNPKGTLYLTASSASGSKFYGAVDKPEITRYIKASKFKIPTYTYVHFKDNQFTMITYGVNPDGSSSVIDEYKMEKVVDKTALKNAVKIAEEKDLSLFTEASGQSFKKAIASAKTAIADKNIRQSKLDEAFALLKEKENELEEKTSQQTLTALDGEVIVSGQFPSGVTLGATKNENPLANKNYETLKKEEGFKGYTIKSGYEIYLVRNGDEYQPTKDVVVKIKQDVSLLEKEIKIAHINREKVAFIKPQVIDGYYTMTVSHFSSFFINYVTLSGSTVKPATQQGVNKNVSTNDTTNILNYVLLLGASIGLYVLYRKKIQD